LDRQLDCFLQWFNKTQEDDAMILLSEPVLLICGFSLCTPSMMAMVASLERFLT